MRRIAVLVGVLGLMFSMVSSFSGSALAHPPDSPYDNTIFAPVRTGGVKIGLEKVTDGLTSPLKAVTAPGQPGRLFVVDQVGRLVGVDLATGRQAVMLDVSARLVPVGI